MLQLMAFGRLLMRQSKIAQDAWSKLNPPGKNYSSELLRHLLVHINVMILKEYSRDAENGFMSAVGTSPHMNVQPCGRFMAPIIIQCAYSPRKKNFETKFSQKAVLT